MLLIIPHHAVLLHSFDSIFYRVNALYRYHGAIQSTRINMLKKNHTDASLYLKSLTNSPFHDGSAATVFSTFLKKSSGEAMCVLGNPSTFSFSVIFQSYWIKDHHHHPHSHRPTYWCWSILYLDGFSHCAPVPRVYIVHCMSLKVPYGLMSLSRLIQSTKMSSKETC